ncbi:MAG: AI-2E family transporter [Acidimicrobiales bacterium]|nr:AI-2E family transporter [Acidimicrobiales bacterium]MBO0886768.1 AI-2E family transporter [Acidimicrobiales bacterium]MBO0893077.1 AI-2E family transporter [Acidimicrobiales bacterium]
MSDQAQSPVPRWLSTSASWAWRLLLLAAGLYVLGLVFNKLRVVIVPVVAALFLTTLLGPPVRWLRRHGWRPLPATWLVFLVAVGVVVGVIFGIIPGLRSEFTLLGRDFTSGVHHIEHWLEHGPLHLSRSQVSSYVSTARNDIVHNYSGVLSGALSGVAVVLELITGLLITMVLTFFFVKDSDKMTRWAVSLFSEQRQSDLQGLGRAVWRALTGYLQGTAVNGVINASLLSIALLAMGVPLVPTLALLTFVGAFVPLVGAILAGVVAALVTLVNNGLVAAIIVIGVTIVIHTLEGYLVGPQVLGRAVRLHPVAILLSLTVGTIVAGVIGTFLAVPVLSVAIAVYHHYRSRVRTTEVPAQAMRPGEEAVPATAAGEAPVEQPSLVVPARRGSGSEN